MPKSTENWMRPCHELYRPNLISYAAPSRKASEQEECQFNLLEKSKQISQQRALKRLAILERHNNSLQWILL